MGSFERDLILFLGWVQPETGGTLPVTARSLETIIRLSTAHAKLKLHQQVSTLITAYPLRWHLCGLMLSQMARPCVAFCAPGWSALVRL